MYIVEEHLPRFLQTLKLVERESVVLRNVQQRLNLHCPISESWVDALSNNPQYADMVESFAAKFGRMQDTIGDKLLPRLLALLAEKTGSTIDNLNRCEHLGFVPDTFLWLEMRSLRNQLVHEYIQEAGQFASAINRANELSSLLFDTHNNIVRHCNTHLNIDIT